MRVPTEEEWRTPNDDDLDVAYARKMFFGKTADEVQPMFRENVLERVSELRFMPAMPFRYYVIAFRDFVLSVADDDDECMRSDAASSFLRLVEDRLEVDPASVRPILSELSPAIEAVAHDQERYGAEASIYGRFTDIARHITELAGRPTKG